jgi:hypothetical protein
MAWRVTIYNRLIHPDFLFQVITPRQWAELCWYYEFAPFGHDVDHLMMARVISALDGKSESEYMPRLRKPMTEEDVLAMFPGLQDGDC